MAPHGFTVYRSREGGTRRSGSDGIAMKGE
jgi:hypothetical protein